MFVTTGLAKRKPLFGRVDHEQVVRSAAGETVMADIREAERHFAGFFTIRSVEVMPDHVHLRFTWPAGRDDALARISRFVGRFKQLSQWHVAGHGPAIWQSGFHDVLCISERCNRTVDGYIKNNPLKWWLMHCDRSLMHVIEPFYLPAGVGGDDLWRAVGNFDLLQFPKLVALRISRRVPERELTRVAEVCLRGAVEKGYVYVSTFFSPGEKLVFKSLAETTSAPIIRLSPTFLDFAYRPHGEEPVLFARKRLLVLSRMPDPAAQPSRDELLGLNATAVELARASSGGKGVYVEWRDGRLAFSPVP